MENSNSWAGLFTSLLTAACVLKIESEHGFRQWYYDRLVVFGIRARFRVDRRNTGICAAVVTPPMLPTKHGVGRCFVWQRDLGIGERLITGQRAVIRRHAQRAQNFINWRCRRPAVQTFPETVAKWQLQATTGQVLLRSKALVKRNTAQRRAVSCIIAVYYVGLVGQHGAAGDRHSEVVAYNRGIAEVERAAVHADSRAVSERARIRRLGFCRHCQHRH